MEEMCRLVGKHAPLPVKAWFQRRGPLFSNGWLIRAEWQGHEILSQVSQQASYRQAKFMHVILLVVAIVVGAIAYTFPPEHFRRAA